MPCAFPNRTSQMLTAQKIDGRKQAANYKTAVWNWRGSGRRSRIWEPPLLIRTGVARGVFDVGPGLPEARRLNLRWNKKPSHFAQDRGIS